MHARGTSGQRGRGDTANEDEAHRDTSGEELTRGTLGAQQSIRMNLSAAQLHDHENEPSWKAPHEKHGISTAALVALVILAAVVLLVVFRVTGII
jgi:hypothetical protein